MPIYEYRCDACGEGHEAIQKISDAPLVRCPHCDQDALNKQISAAGFRLAGGGWYETDFKTGSKRNLAGDSAANAGSGKSDGPKESPKKETKAAS
ncbi:FmdB family zinc ribbon protein [Aestuariirhabdus sp. LZHN29]|uniref:FmdB family zinc ribbon protein n=1 Tax=Aestuariirhabdus sp. LZHN29 TaxID=3417462 RepID=UPI003CE67A8A